VRGNKRFAELLSKLLDDVISDEELMELRGLLASAPEARSELVDQLLLDTLLADSLGEEPLVALVDLVGQPTGLTPEVNRVKPSGGETSGFGRRRWMSISGWLAAAASLCLMTFLFLFTGEQDAFANASQIVEAAIRTHAALIERIYVVEVQRADESREPNFLSRDVQIATQGDRFWVQVRGFREWAWGRNEHGAIWMTLGRRKAVVLSPEEIGPPLQQMGDLYSLQLETLLKNLLKYCRLEVAPGPTTSKVIVATPRRSWTNRPLQRATIEIDRETKAIRKLVIEREFDQNQSTCTFTLVDSRAADESLYRPEGHLGESSEVFGAETAPAKRRELIAEWFGARADRWMRSRELPEDEE
jgi:hypothetical protein